MPITNCKVPGCKSKAPEIKLFHFPRTSNSDLWLKAVNCPILNNIPKRLLHMQKICSKHFTASSFASFQMNSLNRNAVPSLELPCTLSKSPLDSKGSVTFSGLDVGNITNASKSIDLDCVPCIKSTRLSNDLLEKTPFTLPYSESDAHITKSINIDNMLDINGSEISDELVDKKQSCSVEIGPNNTFYLNENVTDLNASCNAGNKDLDSTSRLHDNIHQLRMELCRAKAYIEQLERRSQKKTTDAPPDMHQLKIELSRAKAYIKKLKRKNHLSNLKKMRAVSFEQSVDSLNLSAPANVFLKAQLHQNGQPWSTEEKALFLFFYKNSPKTYRLLESIFNVPCRRTLQRALETSSSDDSKCLLNHLNKFKEFEYMSEPHLKKSRSDKKSYMSKHIISK